MKTQTLNRPSINANLMDLPILKNFNKDEIVTKIDTFRKGEFTLFQALKLAIFGGLAWCVWTYVLPPLFVAIGTTLATVATGVIIVGTILCAPAIVRHIRNFARFLHKKAINYDPFAQFEISRQKMIVQQEEFRASKGKIMALKQDMEIEADKSEKEATAGQAKVVSLQGKAEKIKLAIEELIKNGGVAAKAEDDYVNYNAELQKILGQSTQTIAKLNQSKDFVQKYGSRASIMKKFLQKMTMAETSMEIKISDFDVTIEMLKKDYTFGQKANAATSAAKSALSSSKGWEFDYAFEVVTSTIAADIANTAGNLRDIDSLTSQYAMDSDELYANLNLIADKIKTGVDVVPQAKQYSLPDHKLSSSDKIKSGGFENIF